MSELLLPNDSSLFTQGNNDKALIVEGGAMRGIFATGLLDEFIEHKFNPFNFYCGVSAGALNISAYLAGMKERNLKLYTDFATRPEFMSVSRFMKGGHLLDMDWLWQMMQSHLKLDHKKIEQHRFHVGVTDIQKAQTLFKQAKGEALEQLLKVSSTLPIFYRGFPKLHGQAMTDGGIADAIPVRHAIEQGAKQIMVMRSRLKEYQQKPSVFDHLLAYRYRKQPKLALLFKTRAQRYNETLELIRNPPSGVEILEVCPPPAFSVSRLDRSKENLLKSYELGKQAASGVMGQWHNMNNK
jgi:predicted patatin/cPLA2 family phospholipase